MKWFDYHQNNSGGLFDKDLGYTLWVQANSSDEADSIAQANGVYFNGCDEGLDCDCCGDRWAPAWGRGEDFPKDSEYAKHWDLTVKVIPYGEKIRDITINDQER